MNAPIDILVQITSQQAPPMFGTPFIGMFSKVLNGKAQEESIVAAGIICTLYLSAIKAGFPTMKLHLYVRNVREEVPLFAFDCKSYETLFAAIGEREHLLLDANMEEKKIFIGKQDIFEAFDFITNI